jgi:hypothetical protein
MRIDEDKEGIEKRAKMRRIIKQANLPLVRGRLGLLSSASSWTTIFPFPFPTGDEISTYSKLGRFRLRFCDFFFGAAGTSAGAFELDAAAFGVASAGEGGVRVTMHVF